MNTGMEVVRALPEAEWRSFVEEHPLGNIFHTPEMFQVFAQAKGYEPSLWAAIGDNDYLLALMIPVKVTIVGGLLAPLASRSVVYGGVLCRPSAEGRIALEHLLTAYNQQVAGDTLFTEVRNQAEADSIQLVLQKCGYTYEAHDNFLINLDMSPEAVWNNIHKSARKLLRRALKEGQLTIEEIHHHSQLPIWYALLQKTYQNIQIPLADLSLFESAFDILYPKGMIQFLLGRVGDTYVAASVALLYKKVIYGWYRGFDRNYASYLPNDLMVWKVLEWGSNNGYCIFDFGGAGRPGENYGPRNFKAKFGGALVSYGRNTCIHSPVRLKLSRIGYELVRRFLLVR